MQKSKPGSKAAKRRKSYCARSVWPNEEELPSAETARDPNSADSDKARRRVEVLNGRTTNLRRFHN
jgi:hypothetical protein